MVLRFLLVEPSDQTLDVGKRALDGAEALLQ